MCFFPYPSYALHILPYLGGAFPLLNSYLDTNLCISRNGNLNLNLCHPSFMNLCDFEILNVFFIYFLSVEDKLQVALVRAEALRAL